MVFEFWFLFSRGIFRGFSFRSPGRRNDHLSLLFFLQSPPPLSPPAPPLTFSASHCLSNRNCSATNSSIASAYSARASDRAPSWRNRSGSGQSHHSATLEHEGSSDDSASKSAESSTHACSRLQRRISPARLSASSFAALRARATRVLAAFESSGALAAEAAG